MKIKNLLVSLSLVLATVFGLYAAGNALAADCQGASTTEGAISCGVGGTTGVPVTTTPATKINSTITNIINIISLVGGVLAVVFLIVGGYRYITSGGDTTKTASAKNTILYSLIGLVVVALSQVIVRFVLKQATK